MEAVRPGKKALLEQNNNFIEEPPIPEPPVLPPEPEVIEEQP